VAKAIELCGGGISVFKITSKEHTTRTEDGVKFCSGPATTKTGCLSSVIPATGDHVLGTGWRLPCQIHVIHATNYTQILAMANDSNDGIISLTTIIYYKRPESTDRLMNR
jgi:hypothetical protein